LPKVERRLTAGAILFRLDKKRKKKSMANKHREMQFIIREWKKSTGKTEIDMKEVALYAIAVHHWPAPPPISAEERLAREFAQAAREETRQDGKTGQPYRVYHAVKPDVQGQGVFWVDIDEAPRKHMVKSAWARREQVIGDMTQLTLDLNHWNRVNPNEVPIIAEKDLTPDVNERLASGSGLGEDEDAI
jgi:hypothetical protein